MESISMTLARGLGILQLQVKMYAEFRPSEAVLIDMLAVGLYFQGQRIFSAALEELMSKGMRYASHALLSGCSASGVALIIHCDEFQGLLPRRTTVKCLANAALVLDVADVAGGRSLRSFLNGVVNLQGVGRSLPAACTNRMDATSCFFL